MNLPSEIILATKNRHKARELQELVTPLGIEIKYALDYPDIPEIVEDGDTFQENAIKKASEVQTYTKIASLADDSGLVVEILGGEPGVYSARYAGENANDASNNEKLLRNLEGLPWEKRKAYFVSVIAYADLQGNIFTFKGFCHGYILDEPRGNQGFGYDPLFYIPELNKSMAELSSEEKNKVSHRARAYQEFVNWLRRVTNEGNGHQ